MYTRMHTYIVYLLYHPKNPVTLLTVSENSTEENYCIYVETSYKEGTASKKYNLWNTY